MVKRYLGLFVLLTIGGLLWSKTTASIAPPVTRSTEQRSPAQSHRSANLEAEIIQLKQRLDLLEREVGKDDLTTPADDLSTYTLPPRVSGLLAFVSRARPYLLPTD